MWFNTSMRVMIWYTPRYIVNPRVHVPSLPTSHLAVKGEGKEIDNIDRKYWQHI